MCGIDASDLTEYGGPDAQVMPIGGFRADRKDLAFRLLGLVEWGISYIQVLLDL